MLRYMTTLAIAFTITMFYIVSEDNPFHATLAPQDELWPPNIREEQPPAAASPLHIYEQAAVCSDSEVCSTIGSQLLERGGSAVDAAIATLLCNGLLAMQSMGLGGGMMMNVYLWHERRAYSVLARESTPLLVKSEMFSIFPNGSALQQSGLAIGVPAELMGYAVTYERFGRLPWHELVWPTVELCRSGYSLTKHQYDALHMNKPMVLRDTHLRRMYVDPRGGRDAGQAFRRIGAHIQPPAVLCTTYERLAAEGARSFYNGTLSRSLLADLLDIGSPIGALDLTSLQVELKDSVQLPLDADYVVHLTPPPGSGHIIGFVMNILKPFHAQFAQTKNLGALEIHRIVEALKFGFVQRWQLDTGAEVELLDKLMCPDYARSRAQLINDSFTTNDATFYGASEELLARPEHGTAHVSILAPNGDAVSVTSSINYYFGSGRMGKRTGVLFNNAMSDFSFAHLRNYFDLPYVANRNRVSAQQSPMSSMAPIIVTERKHGDVRLVVGAAGGSKIISALVQLLVRTLWQRWDIKRAIDAARFHHQLLPDKLEYEYGILQTYIEALEEKGHRTKRYRDRGTAVCGVERRGNAVFANADYRKEGGVAGF